MNSPLLEKANRLGELIQELEEMARETPIDHPARNPITQAVGRLDTARRHYKAKLS